MIRAPRLLFAAILLAGVLAWRFAHPRAAGPLQIGIWYWHTRFRITPQDADRLKRMGIRDVYVRAGTFVRAGDGIRLTLPQEWDSCPAGLRVHLVFNFDYGIVRGFERLSRAMPAAILQALADQRKEAEAAGIHPAGVQLDFDCPTRLLPRYAELLATLRPTIQPLTFSITALPTWLSSAEFHKVADCVDFFVPQFYEAQIPQSLDHFTTISRLPRFESGLLAAERIGKPFFAGVPAYGHALVYDGHRKLMGVYHDLGVREAARNPLFRFAGSFPADPLGQPADSARYCGEDIVQFDVRPDESGGIYRVLYDLPSPELVRRHMDTLRNSRPSRCLGAILFRYPEPGETQSVPLESLESAIGGVAPAPALDIRLQCASAPWELIETGRKSGTGPIELLAIVTNRGSGATFVHPAAVQVDLHFDRPGIDEALQRHFDSAESFHEESGDRLKSSLQRANLLRFRKLQLLPGESARLGPIRIPADGATTVRCDWQCLGIGGFQTIRGSVPDFRLEPRR